ncbi:MAG: radical SAM protein [Planctomycetes bacterium]|nr:radical SAM protein [Planctomycetota bacterium]
MSIAINDLYEMLSPCKLCPRECKALRTEGEQGFCKGTEKVTVASIGPHFGEESPLVGEQGSGTIFFSGCNLHCVFCQNFDISHKICGRSVTPVELAGIMLGLQNIDCHNINLVTPTHYTQQIAEAIVIAKDKGLKIPAIYNSSGYDKVGTLAYLDGLIEIYMPDFKFAKDRDAQTYANAQNYPETARAALKEMHRQVGDLEIRDGLAVRGLLVRHLVMPGGGDSAKEIIDFLADEISPRTYINVMGQYHPSFCASDYPELNRLPLPSEIAEAREYAQSKGLRLDDER